MTSIISAFFMPMQGLSLIFDARVKRFVLIPLAINIVIFSLVAWLGVHYFDHFLAWALPEDSWLNYLRWILWPLFALTYFFITFYTFTIIANLIGAPFNGILAAKVEESLTGELPPESDESILKAAIPAIMGELGKLLYLLILSLPVLLLLVIPFTTPIGSILWLVLGFWFLALEYGDYPMGNHGIKPKDQRTRLKRRYLHTLAFGAGASILLLIPIVNFAAMPATVAGATRLWVSQHRN
ncbi:MAG: sulfate transporter CysZ [bacterium]